MFVDISGLHPSANSPNTSNSQQRLLSWPADSDVDLGDQENNKSNKLMGEIVSLLSPAAFKSGLDAILHLSQTFNSSRC